ncbi:hypothetical protein POM88_008910 [Heracleum sosnowskyi]|uniref:Fanconi-associated nuclease n=1 Tax=Heracleum sosnowskyi TaxID=360622 RepID=A0AAD8N7Q5_9APIA|nr:hypothetical protein POM88_008910 [Heracleum sosnowskyi]
MLFDYIFIVMILTVFLSHNESLNIAKNGLLDPWVRAGTRISLQMRVLCLGKPPRRWKTPTFSESVQRKMTEVHVQGRPLNCVTGTKSRWWLVGYAQGCWWPVSPDIVRSYSC